jgi:hypothetical protein
MTNYTGASRRPGFRETEDLRVKAAEHDVAQFNAKCPIGTPVRYWRGAREGDGKTGETRSEAWVVCGHPSVMITGCSGSMALSHVEVIG